MSDLVVSKIDFTFNTTASAPYLFEWQLVNNTYITYSPSTGWSFNLSITKVNTEHSILFNSMTVEDIAIEEPAVETGRIYTIYTLNLPVKAIQKAIIRACSLEYVPIHFSFSFDIGYGVNDNTCYAEGIIYLKLDATTKNLSVINGSISGTVEDQEHTLQQSFSYKTTTGTITTVYDDIPTKPEYIFRKSYGTKCWFDLKLPAVIDPNTYPPVDKSISVYTNATGSISATVLNISSDFKTLNCVVDFVSRDKDVLLINSVPYLISDEVDNTSPIVLQFNGNTSSNKILFTKQNQIKATEFIEHNDNSILFQTGNRIWAKEFIENRSEDFFKLSYNFNIGDIYTTDNDSDITPVTNHRFIVSLGANAAEETVTIGFNMSIKEGYHLSLSASGTLLATGAEVIMTCRNPDTTALEETFVLSSSNPSIYYKSAPHWMVDEVYLKLPKNSSSSRSDDYDLNINFIERNATSSLLQFNKDYSISGGLEFVEV